MYTMWWHKLLSPNEPFILTGNWVEPLCAYMYMSSEVSGDVDENSLRSGTAVKTLLASLQLYSKGPEMKSVAWHIGEHDVVENEKKLSITSPAVVSVDVIPTSLEATSLQAVSLESGKRPTVSARLAS